MARPHDSTGIGCAVFALGVPLAGIVGLVGAGPAVVAYLLVAAPIQLQNYPLWWAAAAAAPVLALVVVRLAASGKAHRDGRIHLWRAAVLLASTTVATLLAMIVSAGSGSAGATGRPAVVAGCVAVVVNLAAYIAIRLRDRALPSRSAPTRDQRRRSGGRRSGGRPKSRRGAGSKRTQQAPKPASQSGSTPTRPRPGEIWWGEVPFRDGDGSTDRPFLVLYVQGKQVTVLPITSQDRSHRRDYLPFQPVGSASDQVKGWLEMNPRPMDLPDVRRRDITRCPPEVWQMVLARFGAQDHRPSHSAAGQRSGRDSRR